MLGRSKRTCEQDRGNERVSKHAESLSEVVVRLKAKALRKDVLHDVTVHISEAEVAPLILDCLLYTSDAADE